MWHNEAVRQVHVKLTDITYGGEALGRLPDGRVLFVHHGMPGEEVVVEIDQEKKDYAHGRVAAILAPSPDRTEPPCPYFLQGCGGCQWQHVAYHRQLAFKRQIVVDQLRRIGGFADAARYVREPIGAEEPWHYRNQVRFSVGRRHGDLGFTQRGTRRLLRIDYCRISQFPINQALALLQGRGQGLRTHQITVRCSPRTGDRLISPTVPGAPIPTGQEFYEDEVLGRRFRVAAPAFFQVNTRPSWRELPEAIRAPWLAERFGLYSMADLLALLVLDRLEPQGDEVVVDAYGGVGTFALLMADRVRRVIGIEESPAAVRDARANAERAGVTNVTFLQGKTEHVLPALDGPVDAVVLDPARVGCHPDVVDALLRLGPPRVVYVSCDPTTLARDLRLLCDGGYDLVEVQPLDMFPQTYHIESVSLLRRGEPRSA